MPLDLLPNVAVAGVMTGMVYGLMALGLSAIFGVMRIVNFAHGNILVLGMYAALTCFELWGMSPIEALPLVTALMFVFGYLLQRGLINRILGEAEHTQFLLLIAIALIVTNGNLIAFGPDARNVQLDYAYDSYEIGPLLMDKVRVLAALLAIACAGALALFFRFTTTGKAIRACADNPTGAQVVGLNVKGLYAMTFGIGTGCAGAAGCLLLMLNDVTPHIATDFTLRSFIIVILGGMGSLGGALLGGVLVGLAEAMSGMLIDPSLKSMVSFGLMIILLLVRPQGLLGRRP